MLFYILALTILGLTHAAPAPQDIDFSLAYAVPNPTYSEAVGVTAQSITYNSETVYASAASQVTASVSDTSAAVIVSTDAASNEKRTACPAQPTGYGPIPSPDSASAFAAFTSFASIASAAPTPSGYSQEFVNLNGSNNAYGYLGYTTLKSYDVNTCAAKCNAINGCLSINIYFERDPSVDPGSGNSGCANPPSTTNIKCVFWGGPVSASNANNYGQWRNKFQVVIAGSNGYTNKTIASVPGYGAAVPLGNSAINAPYDEYGYNTYLGSAIFNGVFDAELCATACSEKSQHALANPPTDGTPVQTCQFFNTYILYINNTQNIQGQYCAMYAESWGSSYATNAGQYRGSDHFLIEYSFAYSNGTNPGSPNPTAAAYQARNDIQLPANSAQSYCSSILSYTTPIATATITSTLTLPAMTSISSVTQTVVATDVAFVKRQDSNTITTPYLSTSGTWIIKLAPATTTGESVAKRAASSTIPVPAVLNKYPSSIITSGCALAISSPTSTSTSTLTIPATATPSPVLLTTTQTITESTTITSTTSTPTPTGIPSSVPCDQTVVNNGFSFAVACNVAWVSGGTLASQSTSTFEACLSNTANSVEGFGFQWTASSQSCDIYSYPVPLSGPDSQNDHYTTEPQDGVVFAYDSDFLSG